MQHAFHDYVLDGTRRELTRGAEHISLEPQVFDVLLYLVQNRDRVVTKDDLIAAVWNGRIVSESTLTSRITAARRAVGDSGEQQALIKTYARKGFRFVGDVRTGREGAAAPQEQTHTVPATAPLGADPDTAADLARRSAATLKWGGRPSVAVLPFSN